MRQELSFQPEPFEFDLETNALETSFDGFENYEASESEAMIGEISRKDYLRWIQFSLNMYFKKTGLRAPLVEDGKDSVEFRNAVNLFNAKATNRSKLKGIDRKFQDTLILANESNSGYLNWIRTQLDKLALAGITMSYATTEKPTLAIKEFQKIWSGNPVIGFSLNRDGFVGAKTHLAILRAVHSLTPTPHKPSELCKICDIIRIAPVDDLAASDMEREELLCLRDFLARGLSGAKVDDRYWTFTLYDNLGRFPCDRLWKSKSVLGVLRNKFPQHAMEVFQNLYSGPIDSRKAAECIKKVHDLMVCQINALFKSAEDNSSSSFSNLISSRECAWMLELHAASRRRLPESVYKCFRKSWLATSNIQKCLPS